MATEKKRKKFVKVRCFSWAKIWRKREVSMNIMILLMVIPS